MQKYIVSEWLHGGIIPIQRSLEERYKLRCGPLVSNAYMCLMWRPVALRYLNPFLPQSAYSYKPSEGYS